MLDRTDSAVPNLEIPRNCMLCLLQAFRAVLESVTGRRYVTRALKKLYSLQDLYIEEEALKNIEEWAPHEAAVFRRKSCQPVRAIAKALKTFGEQKWTGTLRYCKRALAEPVASERKSFRAAVLND